MKTIIVYKSVTGFTKKYADIIANATGAEAVCFKDARKFDFSKYDAVVFGSRAHAGRIDGYRKAMKLLKMHGAKSMVLFVTGAAPNEAQDIIDKFWKDNLEQPEIIPHFYMQAGLCYEKMPLVDRLMMKMAVKFIAKQQGSATASEQDFGKMIASSYDISDEKYAQPLIDFCMAESVKKSGCAAMAII